MPIRKLITKFRRRPFPQNLAALRACRISYGQFGEDLFLTHLLGYEKTDGTYLDIGSYHPIEFSNTYIFYQRGWRGVAIDPNPAFASDWKRFRPKDRFLNLAIADREGCVAYVTNALHPAMNRIQLNPSESLGDSERVIEVPCQSMHEILRTHFPEGKLDLLNIDCEGYDIEILKQIDFSVWQPKVIAAEDPMDAQASEVVSLLQGQHYQCKAHIGLTRIFVRAEVGSPPLAS